MAASRGQCCKLSTLLLLIVLIFLDWSCLKTAAIRPLEAEQRLRNMKKNLIIQSLPRGRVPPSRSNPCTFIPGGKSRGRCAFAVLGEVSGHPAPAPTSATVAH